MREPTNETSFAHAGVTDQNYLEQEFVVIHDDSVSSSCATNDWQWALVNATTAFLSTKEGRQYDVVGIILDKTFPWCRDFHPVEFCQCLQNTEIYFMQDQSDHKYKPFLGLEVGTQKERVVQFSK